MYSVSPVYGQKQFDESNLPTSMYPMKPYYEQGANTEIAAMSPIKIDPMPSLPSIDFENDRDSRLLLEDLYYRQLLFFCRLNDLQRNITNINDVQIQSGRCLSDLKQNLLDEKHEDIVVHFDPNQPPLTLLTVLSILNKHSPKSILVNLHLHSSLSSDTNLILQIKSLQMELKKMIGFEFNSIAENTDRTNCMLTISFIAKNLNNEECWAVFKSNQPTIKGELNIIQKLSSLVVKSDDSTNQFWKLLCDTDLQSPKQCIERIGQYFVGLDDKKFLINSKEPRLLDLVVWSLSKNSSTLKSLIDPNWDLVIRSLLF